ncbi:MAG: hypothetical protein ACJAUV_002402, partial [Flavobacteriales bacterium]
NRDSFESLFFVSNKKKKTGGKPLIIKKMSNTHKPPKSISFYTFHYRKI